MLVGEELREISGIGGNLMKAFYTGYKGLFIEAFNSFLYSKNNTSTSILP